MMPSSLRKQGPIATGVSLAKNASSTSFNHGHNAVWVPGRAEPVIGRAFARPVGLPGTTLGLDFRFTCHTAIANTTARCRDADRARALRDFRPPCEKEGAGKTGCALHPRSRAQMETRKRTRAYRFSGGNPAFPARWFTAYFALSSVTGLSCHRRPREALASRRLDASVGAPGPRDFAVRVVRRSSCAATRVHRIPPRVRDDREPPLSSGETARLKR